MSGVVTVDPVDEWVGTTIRFHLTPVGGGWKPRLEFAALSRIWDRLLPGRRVAVMEMSIAETRLRTILAPIARQLNKLVPGRADARPWDDLAPFGEVVTTRFLHLFCVCSVAKRGAPSN